MKNNMFKRSRSLLKYCLLAIAIWCSSISVATLSSYIPIHKYLGFSENRIGMVISMTEGIVAAASISFVFYQLRRGAEEKKRQRNIAEAQFILQYNRVFMENKQMFEVEKRLEEYTYNNKKGQLITKKNRQYFINYLVYFEGLASSIMRDELSLDHIDDLMAYRFFLVINNPEIQEKELFKFPDYYRGCFNLYKKWKRLRLTNDKEIPQIAHSLDKWVNFDRYIESD